MVKGKSNFPKKKNTTISNQCVRKLLDKIKPTKATGPDQIYGKVLKELSSDMTTAITFLRSR